MRPNNEKSIRNYFIGASTIIGFVFGGLLAWSVLAPFEGAIITSGTIVVESQNKAIQHLEGGIVADIHVREGDLVEAGDKLISLDATAILSARSALDAKLLDLISEEARLVAERDGNEALELRRGATDLQLGDALDQALQSQKEYRAARRQSLATQISVLRNQEEQLNRQRSGIQADIASKDRQLLILNEELSSIEFMMNRQLAPRAEVLGLRREKASIEGAIESLTAEMARVEVQIGETTLERNRIRDSSREEVLARLSDARTEIAELIEQRITVNDRLARVEIKAPRKGRVVGVTTHTLGGVIAAGEPIMHIVPKDDRLVANVRVSPQDIDKVEPGQTVTLRLSAFNQNTTPEVDGQILTISADAIEDPNLGVSYYQGIVQLPPSEELPAHVQLYPGMPVDALVRTESRTVLSYLIRPAQDAMSKTFRE
ncbi:MAG: HlyD family type I secretion periplasmic adaptor subunit [Henriciella sp.]|nr:HlyD family type I secretion periplasmic adaptor subunit [Henriciella sp.]